MDILSTLMIQAQEVKTASALADDEQAHYEQDKLYRLALTAILDAPEIAKDIAEIALSTEAETFSHWYA